VKEEKIPLLFYEISVGGIYLWKPNYTGGFENWSQGVDSYCGCDK